MGDETVILNHKEGVYFNVEGVGSVIWQRLQKAPQTLESLIKAVMDEFDTDEATCRSDIEAFLDELMHEKLVEMA
ncbi:MAG: PqqD family peptide modification chaperone [Spirosomaceae bacterium]|jgi:hypothetical protein|nr:PqqD family peptide modification chaperone [Spirosomataceae bacterium]